MKQAHPLQILGAPKATGRTIECPSCGGDAQVNEDGSLLCTKEVRFFEPDPSCAADGEFVAVRQTFDRAHGIGVSARLTIPLNIIRGVAHRRDYTSGRARSTSAAA